MSDAEILTALPSVAFTILLVFCRVGGLVMLMPGLGEVEAPAMARVGLALGLTLFVFPNVPLAAGTDPDHPAAAISTILAEVATGLSMGFLARLPALALGMGAAVISTFVGLSSILQPDPALGGQSTAIARLFGLAAPVLILTSGLYRLPLAAIAGTYDLVGIGGAFSSGDTAQSIARGVSDAFALGLQLSAPFLIASVVWQIAVGLLARMAPQLQAFAVTVPGQILGGLVLVGLLAPELIRIWQLSLSAGWASLPGS